MTPEQGETMTDYRRKDPQILHDQKPCPFCGAAPEIQGWHDGGRDKRLVACSNTECDVAPSVTGSSRVRALAKWNTRGAR